MRELTQDTLKELLDYNPTTGEFTWKWRDRKWFKSEQAFKSWNKKYASKVAKCKNSLGYVQIRVFNTHYLGHTLAWLYVKGGYPVYQIDHIDGKVSNNAIVNLRDVPQLINSRNRKVGKRNTSGLMGVSWHKASLKWRVRIGFEYIGLYRDFFDACCARKSAENKFGFHSNHGRSHNPANTVGIISKSR
jgi:hypothetical protein